MSRHQWNGQELYKYDGTFVFIVEHLHSAAVKVAYRDSGDDTICDPDMLVSATPEELEEIS